MRMTYQGCSLLADLRLVAINENLQIRLQRTTLEDFLIPLFLECAAEQNVVPDALTAKPWCLTANSTKLFSP